MSNSLYANNNYCSLNDAQQRNESLHSWNDIFNVKSIFLHISHFSTIVIVTVRRIYVFEFQLQALKTGIKLMKFNFFGSQPLRLRCVIGGSLRVRREWNWNVKLIEPVISDSRWDLSHRSRVSSVAEAEGELFRREGKKLMKFPLWKIIRVVCPDMSGQSGCGCSASNSWSSD